MDKLIVGRLGAPYGIRGWLKVQAFTDDAEGIFAYSPWFVGRDGVFKEMAVAKWRRHNKGLVVLLDGIEDRNGAELLTGQEIAVAAEQLPALPEDEFYWRDLIGLKVVNTQGYDMGVVDSLMETGSNDVLVVKSNGRDAFGKSQRLIPFVTSQFITKVDAEAGVIEVDWDPSF